MAATVFGFHHIGNGVGAEFAGTHAAWRANVGQVHCDRIVHGKVLVRIQEGRHLFKQMTTRVSPITHPYAGTVKIIGQSVGSQVDMQIIVVVPRARLFSDGLPQGANHFL